MQAKLGQGCFGDVWMGETSDALRLDLEGELFVLCSVRRLPAAEIVGDAKCLATADHLRGRMQVKFDGFPHITYFQLHTRPIHFEIVMQFPLRFVLGLFFEPYRVSS